MFVLLATSSVIIGIFIGMVGVGGILLIPVLSGFAGLSTHASMATALFSFLFTGIAGACLYQRYGSIDWHITVPMCAGAVLFAYLGALAGSLASAQLLRYTLSIFILFAGIYTLYPLRRTQEFKFDAHSGVHRALLFGIGALVGFGSGLTGTGGPVLSVPIMMICGFAPLTSIAASQVIQIAVGLSGTMCNVAHGAIDFGFGLLVTVLELAGVLVGVQLIHRAGARQIKNCVAVACIIVGAFMLCSAAISDLAPGNFYARFFR